VHGHRGRCWTGDVHSGVDVERTLTGQLPVQPNLGGAPVAPDRDRRDLEHLRRLVDGEAAEKAQLDDLGFLGVDARELVQSVIEGGRSLLSVRATAH
jgi:L-rhamnose isomerase